MVQFFKYSGPIQVIVLFFLIFFLKAPLFFTDAPLLIEDLKHHVVGERMASGYLMYRDIIDSTPPLSAFIYWLVSSTAKRSQAAYFILGAIFIFIQSILFRKLCNENEILSERGDIPMLVYATTSFLCYDFVSLSPALISLTFILLALHSTFKHLRISNNEGEIFTTGFYVGLAYLCYLPAIIFLPITFFVLLSSSRTNFRYYLLFLTGFLFPILFLCTTFFWNDGFNGFISYYIFNFPLSINLNSDIDISAFFFILYPTLIIGFIGTIRSFTYRRFIIYQVIIQRVMFLSLISVLIFLILFFHKTTSSFMLLMPFIAFFVTHFFHFVKRRPLGGYFFFIYLFYSLRSVYSYLPIKYIEDNLVNFNQQISYDNSSSNSYINKKVAVFGDNITVFRNNKLATPYLDWQLAGKILQHTDTYKNVIRIYEDFRSDMPEVIIDENNVMPSIFNAVPFIKNSYLETQTPGTYVRK